MSEFRRCLALGFAMFVSILVLISIVPVTRPAQAADVEAFIVLHQATQEMPVQAGMSRTVSFSGTATCNVSGMGSGWEEVIVRLTGRTTSGWTVSITPAEMTFEAGGEPQGFTVTVNAPEGSLPQTTAETLTVDGSADEMLSTFVVASYNIAPVSAMITIQQYYGTEVSCQDQVKEAGSSTSVTYILLVKNQGNGMDTYYVNRVDYSRNPEMPDKGFKLSFEPEELLLTGRAEGNIVVTLVTPKDTPESKVYNFTLYIRSKGSESGGVVSEDSLSLVLQTKGGLSDIVNSGNLVLFVGAGAVVIVLLAIIVIVVIVVRKRRARKN